LQSHDEARTLSGMAQIDWSEVGERLRIIRTLVGYGDHGGQKQFARDFKFGPTQWNNWENGHPIPWQEAVRVTSAVPGLTLDWIYLGVRDGLTVKLDTAIADLPPRKRSPGHG
jgi:hypothetical protein